MDHNIAVEMAKTGNIQADAEISHLVDEFAPAYAATKLIGHYADFQKGQIKQKLFSLWIEALWAKGSPPKNPTIEGDNCSLVFIVENKRTQVPEDLDAKLITAGISKVNAYKIFTNEVEVEPVFNLGKLLNSDEKEDEKIGIKMMNWLKGISKRPPTIRERALVLDYRTYVKKDFLERVVEYVDSKRELEVVLETIKPNRVVRSVKYILHGTKVESDVRLVKIFNKVIGEKNASEKVQV